MTNSYSSKVEEKYEKIDKIDGYISTCDLYGWYDCCYYVYLARNRHFDKLSKVGKEIVYAVLCHLCKFKADYSDVVEFILENFCGKIYLSGYNGVFKYACKYGKTKIAQLILSDERSWCDDFTKDQIIYGIERGHYVMGWTLLYNNLSHFSSSEEGMMRGSVINYINKHSESIQCLSCIDKIRRGCGEKCERCGKYGTTSANENIS